MMLHLYEQNAARKKFEFVNRDDQSQGRKVTAVRKKKSKK